MNEKTIDNENMYFYFLQSVPGIGNKTIASLTAHFETAKNIYSASEKQLQQFLSERQLKQFIKEKDSKDIIEEYRKLLDRGISYFPIMDCRYPKRLLEIPDAPQAIFVKGKLPQEEIPAVAIVGARNCSPYGSLMAMEYAKILAFNGINVISGMARGIDGIAQNAALHHGGRTYAVLGSGVDVCYPKENLVLYNDIIVTGGIISEYLPQTQPQANLFPKRNRIISGLSDVLMVIEAKEKSGTLITVDMALEQGREVYALPGRATDSLSSGCNRLIRQGANLLPNPTEFLEEFKEYLIRTKKSIKTISVRENQPSFHVTLTREEQIVCKNLDYTPKTSSAILRGVNEEESMDLNISKLMEILTNLCIKGIVGHSCGTYYLVNGKIY